ncbi:MAG: dienelactone hydrolase family protein [Clostridia bacterium]|nr:dienelactone hydrolase family protein [Clostridia bacterium]
MNYREEKNVTERNKKEYVSGFEHIIAERQRECESRRASYIADIFSEQGRYREDFKKMLGWPLVGYKAESIPEPSMQKLADEDGYSVWRMEFEILEGLKMSGLFFKAESKEPKPLVIVQHGGLGTPELISGVYGDTSNYNDMLQRVIKYGVHAFAPQLLLWAESYEVEFDRKAIDARLKRVGSSVTAVEVYGITKILDYFETQDYVTNFGMVGLSYGGFYTLFTTAIDTRIKSAVSCSFFNKRDAVGWSDWTWFNSAEQFDDAEIACLVYPRRLCIEVGDADELFDYKNSQDSFAKLKKMCERVGTDWVEFIVFGGVHEFCRDDAPIERLVNDISK